MKISDLDPLEQESIQRGIPIVGSEKGAWLLQKIQETKPKRILELGTANGYSGCILGSEGAELVTIEKNPEIAEEANKNFHKQGVNAWIIIGDGVGLVEKMAQEGKKYDLIFVDFYKKGYMKVLENCIKLLNSGGLLVADNISFENCQDFKEAVMNHPKLETEIVYIRDGLSLSRKK